MQLEVASSVSCFLAVSGMCSGGHEDNATRIVQVIKDVDKTKEEGIVDGKGLTVQNGGVLFL